MAATKVDKVDVVDALTGFRQNAAAASGKYLRGDGTNFASSSLLLRDAADGAWTTYSPTITSGTGSFTTVSGAGRYLLMGKTMLWFCTVTITTNGTAATDVIVPLPGGVTLANAADTVAFGRAAAVSGKMLQGVYDGTGSILVFNYDNTYPGASGETLELKGVMETA